MLNNKYYKKMFGFLDQGIAIFDDASKKLEYINDEFFRHLNLKSETIDYKLCEELNDDILKKTIVSIKNTNKIVFSISDYSNSKELLRNGPMVIFNWLNKDKWPTSYVSENVQRILGYTVDEFVNGKIFYSEIIHEDDLNRVISEVNYAINNDLKLFYHEPYRLIQANGNEIWVSDFTIVIRDENDQIIGFHGYISDISEMMYVKNALLEEKKRSKDIIKAANLGTWEWDFETDKVIHNDQWYEILGYSSDDFNRDDINDIISHPDDLEKAYNELKKHIKGEKPFYEIERRIKRKDNSYAWILDKGRITEYLKDHKPKKMFGVHVDISQQKIIEERFKLFMDTAKEIFIILDQSLNILEINKAGLSLISEDVSKEAIVGNLVHEVLPFLSDEIQKYKPLINKQRQVFKIEKHYENKNNEFYKFDLFKINDEIGLIGHDITSSVIYQNSIEQMNKNFNKILSSSAFGVILVNMNRKVKWANDMALKILGVNNLQEIQGKYCQNFICIDNEKRKCPLEEDTNYATVECKIRGKNDKLIEIMKKAELIEYEGEKVILESFVDISERKVIERKLEKETQRLKNIYRIANIGVFDFDFNNNEFYMNKNQYKIIELPVETKKNELMEKIKERISLRDYKRIKNIRAKGSFSLEMQLHTPAGKKYIKVYGNTSSKSNKQYDRVIGACIDITNLKEAEHKALEASKSKSAFLANMSHEIKTPLNGILGFTDALLKTNLEPKQMDYLNTIKSSGTSLTEIIEDILNLSKIEAGKMSLVNEYIDLEIIISEAIDIVKLDSYQKDVKLLYNVNIEEGILINIDRVRIKQVLINLLGNAIKFTDDGYVRLNVNKKNGLLHFEIIDTGIGISIENQRKIMDSFYQGNPQITRKYGGTGLGLTISSRILNLMGSKLQVESEIGKGSKFYFKIKTEIISKERLGSSIPSKASQILVIDPDEIANKSLFDKIKNTNYSGLSVKSLLEAINEIEENIDIKNIIISTDFDIDEIKNFINILEKKNNAYDVYISSFKLYNKDSINKRYENIKYEYISRPLSRKKIKILFSKKTENRKNSIKKAIVTNKKINILIAEDNNVNMKLIKTIIRSFLSNVNIIEAINGEEVIELLKNKKIDLIFMDVQMPKMDGIKATKIIRDSKNNIPIIGLTALTQKEDQLKSIAVGMNDFIKKPISRNMIYNTLKKWIAKDETEDLIDVKKHIDDVALLDNLFDDRDLLRELYEESLNDWEKDIINIKKHIKNDEIDPLKKIIHRMKGTAKNLHFDQLATLLKDFEVVIDSSNSNSKFLELIEEEYNLLKRIFEEEYQK